MAEPSKTLNSAERAFMAQGVAAWETALWLSIGGVLGATLGMRWAFGVAGLYFVLGVAILAAPVGLSIRDYIRESRRLADLVALKRASPKSAVEVPTPSPDTPADTYE
jgi:hypothetical protein